MTHFCFQHYAIRISSLVKEILTKEQDVSSHFIIVFVIAILAATTLKGFQGPSNYFAQFCGQTTTKLSLPLIASLAYNFVMTLLV